MKIHNYFDVEIGHDIDYSGATLGNAHAIRKELKIKPK